MKRLLIGIFMIGVAYIVGADYLNHQKFPLATSVAAQPGDILGQAYARRLSNVRVWGQGVVIKMLRDDNEGLRHQRFIVRLPSGQTVLIAHNIDLATRIDSLREGDMIEFSGEYEWNPKGGTIHWTHRDSAGRHVAGWVKHKGRMYQ